MCKYRPPSCPDIDQVLCLCCSWTTSGSLAFQMTSVSEKPTNSCILSLLPFSPSRNVGFALGLAPMFLADFDPINSRCATHVHRRPAHSLNSSLTYPTQPPGFEVLSWLTAVRSRIRRDRHRYSKTVKSDLPSPL